MEQKRMELLIKSPILLQPRRKTRRQPLKAKHHLQLSKIQLEKPLLSLQSTRAMAKKAKKKMPAVQSKVHHSSNSSLSEIMLIIRDALETVETEGWIDLAVGPLHLTANVTQFSHFSIFGYVAIILQLLNTSELDLTWHVEQ